MKNLLELADQKPPTFEVTTSEQINEELFKQFIRKNPVWDFHCISRKEY